MSSIQIEELKILAIFIKYKTVSEKKAFIDGYRTCLENEKRKLEEEKRVTKERWKEEANG
mgnify:CR=1 FL=1